MKIFGNIMISIGLLILIYTLFVPVGFDSSDSVEGQIQSVNNKANSSFGFIFIIVGILGRQGLWDIK